MRQRLAAGRWQWVAPIGYMNGRNGQPSLVLDPQRGPLVAKLFDLVASGEMAKSEALKSVTAMGLRTRNGAKLSPETLRRVLTNPLYGGTIFSAKWGQSVKGDFIPLVHPKVFAKVQAVLEGRAAISSRGSISRETSFSMRGFLLCPTCNQRTTASVSTGKAGGKFAYYHCHRGPEHFRARAEVVEDAFVSLLETLTPEPDRMRLIEAIVRQVWAAKLDTVEVEIKSLRTELVKLEAKKARILDQLADGVLAGEDFRAIDGKIAGEFVDVTERLSVSESNHLDVDTAVAYLAHLLWNTSAIWQTSDFKGKQRIQRSVFPCGIPIAQRLRMQALEHP